MKNVGVEKILCNCFSIVVWISLLETVGNRKIFTISESCSDRG